MISLIMTDSISKKSLHNHVCILSKQSKMIYLDVIADVTGQVKVKCLDLVRLVNKIAMLSANNANESVPICSASDT